MLNSNYNAFLSFIEGKKILITTHDLVDIDGLASCYTLKFFLVEYVKILNVTILLSELSKPTKNFMKRFIEKFPNFKFEFENKVDYSNYDLCILVDAGNLGQLRFDDKKGASLEIPFIIIDHHHYIEENLEKHNIDKFNLIDDNSSSTAEILLRLFKYFNQLLTTPYKYLIISGILIDSGYFRYGSNETVKNVSYLIGEDVNFQDFQLLLKNEIHISEKIAKIKGLKRVDLIRKGDYLIGTSNVSSFGASVASMLIKIGFDISIVFSKEKNKNIINTRADKNVCLKTGLHLGKLLEETSKSWNSIGGGHEGAASLTVTTNSIDKVLNDVVERIKQFL
ncbi:MAG: bifunctional oligoribonuclease/PAP phosphatase NrnA [Promethearchaeota archaeon]